MSIDATLWKKASMFVLSDSAGASTTSSNITSWPSSASPARYCTKTAQWPPPCGYRASDPASPSTIFNRSGMRHDNRCRRKAVESADDELIAVGVDGDVVALGDGAVEDRRGQPVADLPLDHPLERAGPERRVVPLTGDERRRVGRDLERDAPSRQPLTQVSQLDL